MTLFEFAFLVANFFLPTFAQYGLFNNLNYDCRRLVNAGFVNPFPPYQIDPRLVTPSSSSSIYGLVDNETPINENRDDRDCRGLPSMRARSICRYGSGGAQPPLSIGGATGMSGCVDMHPQCPMWASTGQCTLSPTMMRTTCPLSCGTCLITTTLQNLQTIPSLQNLQTISSLQNLQTIPSLQNLQTIPNLQNLQTVPSLQNLQNLQTIPSLQNLQTIPNLQNLQTSPYFGYRFPVTPLAERSIYENAISRPLTPQKSVIPKIGGSRF